MLFAFVSKIPVNQASPDRLTLIYKAGNFFISRYSEGSIHRRSGVYYSDKFQILKKCYLIFKSERRCDVPHCKKGKIVRRRIAV